MAKYKDLYENERLGAIRLQNENKDLKRKIEDLEKRLSTQQAEIKELTITENLYHGLYPIVERIVCDVLELDSTDKIHTSLRKIVGTYNYDYDY